MFLECRRLQHSCEWHDGLLEFASCGYWGQNQNTMGPSQGRPNACLSNSVPGFGVPKHQSHSINLPQAAILCGFDRLMQIQFLFSFCWWGLWGRTLIPLSNLDVAKAGCHHEIWLWMWCFGFYHLRDCFCWFSRQSSQHKENPSLNPPFFGFHVRLGWVYISNPSYKKHDFLRPIFVAKLTPRVLQGVQKISSFQLLNLQGLQPSCLAPSRVRSSLSAVYQKQSLCCTTGPPKFLRHFLFGVSVGGKASWKLHKFNAYIWTLRGGPRCGDPTESWSL